MIIYRKILQTIIFVLTVAFLLAGFSGNALAQDDSPLPPGPNRDLVLGTCTICHSAKLILQNRMTRERWDETITWMQETQGLWELDADSRGKILDYLATVRGVDGKTDKGKPGYLPNPMYEFDYPPNPL